MTKRYRYSIYDVYNTNTKKYNNYFRKFIIIIYYIMSTIPKQNLVIDDTIDIGLTADLINGTYKTSSLTDLSNNVYSKISDLSSNVYTALGTKQANLTSTTNLLGIGTSISELNYNNISLNKPDLSV